MSEEKRKCQIEEYGVSKKGTFIKYAPIQYYDEANQSYIAEKAIVELDDGKVVTVDPQCIRFCINGS
ncbi:hypothetical protein [uncultured Amphritea sp.]|uniref:hypothetical protein n=1 Tax=uncultured Amphritea sp. TaxID=981605 RepID=UPI002624ABE8|nr:hypothetical protein [uncultured Amphritea sp.]